MRLTTRPMTEQDREWLWALMVVTLKAHVEQTYGPWDNEWQRARFDADFPNANERILVRDDSSDEARALAASVGKALDGEDVGAVRVEERADGDIFLVRILVMPRKQGRGIGSACIEMLKERRRPIVLYVMKVNARARALYARLGFVDVESDKATHWKMRWAP